MLPMYLRFMRHCSMCIEPIIYTQETDGEFWVSGRDHEEALEKAAAKFKVPKDVINLKWGKRWCALLL